tara:strand:- start:324 stop:734 length:411 start_codon:yes stop_codon:yes gene_type:complete
MCEIIIGIEGSSVEYIEYEKRELNSHELIMKGRRPSTECVAKSNGSGTGDWVKSLATLNEQEHQWQRDALSRTTREITNYESDAKIPDLYSELRVTNYTEDDYYAFLGDRKLLVEYVKQEDFPECDRPKLSGLIPN